MKAYWRRSLSGLHRPPCSAFRLQSYLPHILLPDRLPACGQSSLVKRYAYSSSSSSLSIILRQLFCRQICFTIVKTKNFVKTGISSFHPLSCLFILIGLKYGIYPYIPYSTANPLFLNDESLYEHDTQYDLPA